MGRHLQSVGINYSIEQFVGMDACVSQRIREAATAFEYFLGKAKIASRRTVHVNLIGGSDLEHITEHLNIIDYAHPYYPIDKLSRNENIKVIQATFTQEATDALNRLSVLRGWDVEAIRKLHQQLRKKNYRFEEVWVKPRTNASRTYTVGVEWKTESCTEIGFILGRLGSGDVAWHRIMSLETGLGLIENVLGRFSWESDSLARLWNKNKRDYWELDTQTMHVEFHYGPADDGNPHGQYALAKMYLDGNSLVNRDPIKAAQWLKKSADQGFMRARRLLETLSS